MKSLLKLRNTESSEKYDIKFFFSDNFVLTGHADLVPLSAEGRQAVLHFVQFWNYLESYKSERMREAMLCRQWLGYFV